MDEGLEGEMERGTESAGEGGVGRWEGRRVRRTAGLDVVVCEKAFASCFGQGIL